MHQNSSVFEPSRYQKDIVNWVNEGEGNAFVEAVAGSGKTTTLRLIAERCGGVGIFVCFAKAIAEDLSKKLPEGWKSSTLDSIAYRLGAASIGRMQVESGKYYPIASKAIDRYGLDEVPDISKTLMQMIDFQRATRTPFKQAAMTDLCEKMGFIVPDELRIKFFQAVRWCLGQGLDLDRIKKDGLVDFNDLRTLVAEAHLPVRQKHHWVLVDEAQDLNRVQMEMIKHLLVPGGRIIFVGDRHQAIFGFNGSDSEAVDHIIESFDAKLFPLPVSYRCSLAVVSEAQAIVPHIVAREGAEEGMVEKASYDEMMEAVSPGDFIIARTGMPLLHAAIALSHKGMPVDLKKFDREVHGWLDAYEKDGGQLLPRFAIERARSALIGRHREAGAEYLIPGEEERAIALLSLAVASGAKSFGGLHAAIKKMSQPGGVTLLTAHGSKGLETSRVWLLGPEDFPYEKATKAWEIEQEFNLKYVAMTRAKSDLFFVKKQKRAEAVERKNKRRNDEEIPF